MTEEDAFPLSEGEMHGAGGRARFSAEEDAKLFRLQQQKLDWNEISKQLGNRSARQCRERFQNYLDPDLNTTNWTPDEDELLLQKESEMGKKWKKMMPYFQNRSNVNIKNRFATLQNRKKANERIESLSSNMANQQNSLSSSTSSGGGSPLDTAVTQMSSGVMSQPTSAPPTSPINTTANMNFNMNLSINNPTIGSFQSHQMSMMSSQPQQPQSSASMLNGNFNMSTVMSNKPSQISQTFNQSQTSLQSQQTGNNLVNQQQNQQQQQQQQILQQSLHQQQQILMNTAQITPNAAQQQQMMGQITQLQLLQQQRLKQQQQQFQQFQQMQQQIQVQQFQQFQQQQQLQFQQQQLQMQQRLQLQRQVQQQRQEPTSPPEVSLDTSDQMIDEIFGDEQEMQIRWNFLDYNIGNGNSFTDSTSDFLGNDMF